jgi:hypothetical protein
MSDMHKANWKTLFAKGSSAPDRDREPERKLTHSQRAKLHLLQYNYINGGAQHILPTPQRVKLLHTQTHKRITPQKISTKFVPLHVCKK